MTYSKQSVFHKKNFGCDSTHAKLSNVWRRTIFKKIVCMLNMAHHIPYKLSKIPQKKLTENVYRCDAVIAKEIQYEGRFWRRTKVVLKIVRKSTVWPQNFNFWTICHPSIRSGVVALHVVQWCVIFVPCAEPFRAHLLMWLRSVPPAIFQIDNAYCKMVVWQPR